MELTKRLTETHKIALKFDQGDHWQGGTAFLPFVSLDTAKQDAQRAQMLASLETENVIAEVLDNEQNAVFGRDSDWQIVPPQKSLEDLAKQTEADATDYWVDFDIDSILKETNRLAGCQERAIIRAFVPKGLLTGRDNKSKLRDAMNLIRFEVLNAEQAAVFLDDETYKHFGFHQKDTKLGERLTETTYVENGQTFVKIVRNSNFTGLAESTLSTLKTYMPTDKETVDDTSYDLDGELLYFEYKRKPLITDSVISNQKDVNLCLTMKNRLTYQSAYRDFFLFNAKRPIDKDGNPSTIKTGGKAANFIAGEDVLDDTGTNITNYATPSMTVVEPVSAENVITAKEASAFAIYNQTSQVHLTRNQSTTESGVSKRESRFSFEKKAQEIKQVADAAGRWMLKVLVLFAADNINQSELYKQFRFDFNCRIDAGAPDAEEIAQAAADVKEGLLSEETYLSKYLRFDDADAEKARIVESDSYKVATLEKRIEVLNAAGGLMTLEEKRRFLYPEKSDEEIRKDLEKLAKEAGTYETV